jgi:hypothetical protein
MHEWIRAERSGFCGGCDKVITVGEPVRLTSIVGIRRQFIRCEECAGAAPYELPPISVLVPDREPRQPLDARAHLGDGDGAAREWMPYRDE